MTRAHRSPRPQLNKRGVINSPPLHAALAGARREGPPFPRAGHHPSLVPGLGQAGSPAERRDEATGSTSVRVFAVTILTNSPPPICCC